jgi:hypothetical protein
LRSGTTSLQWGRAHVRAEGQQSLRTGRREWFRFNGAARMCARKAPAFFSLS